MVVPEKYEIALDVEAALFQFHYQFFRFLYGEFHVVEEGAVHNDERVFDDVRYAVVAHVVKRVRVASAATETATFGETEGVVVGDAYLTPQV